jgi:hypothetical protein
MAHALASRSRYIPWLFVAGFAVVIAVNATMIWFAVGSFSGLYTPACTTTRSSPSRRPAMPWAGGSTRRGTSKAAASRSRCSIPRASRWPARA